MAAGAAGWAPACSPQPAFSLPALPTTAIVDYGYWMRGKIIHVWDLFFIATFCEGVLFFYVQLITVTLIMPFPLCAIFFNASMLRLTSGSRTASLLSFLMQRLPPRICFSGSPVRLQLRNWLSC